MFESIHPFSIVYLEKGKIVFQIGEDGSGEMRSTLLQLVTLWNVLGKVFSGVVIDTGKWRRLKRSLQAPLINLHYFYFPVHFPDG